MPDDDDEQETLTRKRQSVLVMLTVWANVLEFNRKNRHPEMLPHGSAFFRRPISFIQQYIEVYKLNNEEDSKEYKAKREYELGDVERRRLYREAHDMPEVTGVAAWLGLGTVEEEMRLRKKREEEEKLAQLQVEQEARDAVGLSSDEQNKEVKPKRRVFFGIW